MYVHFRLGVAEMSREKVEPSQHTDRTTEEERFRTTVYLTEGELSSLDELRTIFRRQERRQIGRSEIIREAIRHYHATLREG